MKVPETFANAKKIGNVTNPLSPYSLIIENYGWRMAVRVSSMQMVLVALISLLLQSRLPKKVSSTERLQQKSWMLDTTVFKNKAFVAFTGALFIYMLSYQVPFVHLVSVLRFVSRKDVSIFNCVIFESYDFLHTFYHYGATTLFCKNQ